MIYIYLIISFILEGFVSNLVRIDTLLFNNCFVLTSLLVISNYFKTDKKYYILSFITGFIYDITYTDKILINAYLFLILSIVIKKLNKKAKEDIFFVIIELIITIIIYRIISYAIFILIDGINYTTLKLIKSIVSSMVLNIIYLYLSLLFKEKNFKKIRKNRC